MSTCTKCGGGGRWGGDDCPRCEGTGRSWEAAVSGAVFEQAFAESHPASVGEGQPSVLRTSAPEVQDAKRAYETHYDGRPMGVILGANHLTWDAVHEWFAATYGFDPEQLRVEPCDVYHYPIPASVEAGPSRGAVAPLAPEGIDALIAAARAWRKDAAAMDAWADGGDGDRPDWDLARAKERALFAAVDALDASPAPISDNPTPPAEGISDREACIKVLDHTARMGGIWTAESAVDAVLAVLAARGRLVEGPAG